MAHYYYYIFTTDEVFGSPIQRHSLRLSTVQPSGHPLSQQTRQQDTQSYAQSKRISPLAEERSHNWWIWDDNEEPRQTMNLLQIQQCAQKRAKGFVFSYTYQLSMASQDNPSKLFIDLFFLIYITAVSVAESTLCVLNVDPSMPERASPPTRAEASSAAAAAKNGIIILTLRSSHQRSCTHSFCAIAIGSHNYFNTFFISGVCRKKKILKCNL